MKLWIPIAAVALLVVAYLFFYELALTEGQGTSSLGLANAAGMVAVLLGLVAAFFILRRGAPPAEPTNSNSNSNSNSRNP